MVKLVQANEWTWYRGRGGRTRSSPRKVTELGVHSLGLVLLRVRFSGLKLLKQVQLVSTPGIALVDRTARLVLCRQSDPCAG